MTERICAYRRKALREFLTVKRQGLQPSDVGLPTRARRRVRGLNRDEVAALAGISPGWYERFETLREGRPGVKTLENVALALRLTWTETAYLRLLALDESPPNAPFGCEDFWFIAQAEGLVGNAIFDANYQLVRSNDVHDWLFGYDAAKTSRERNALHRIFSLPSRRRLWRDDWSSAASRMVGKVRWMAAVLGETPRVVDELSNVPEFRELWDAHVVDLPQAVRNVTLDHRDAGQLEIRIYAPVMEPGFFAAKYVPATPETVEKLRRRRVLMPHQRPGVA